VQSRLCSRKTLREPLKRPCEIAQHRGVSWCIGDGGGKAVMSCPEAEMNRRDCFRRALIFIAASHNFAEQIGDPEIRCAALALVHRYPNRGDEPVTAPMNIDDEPVPITSIAQRAAQSGHLHGEVPWLDKYIGPNPIHQFLLGDQLAWSF
jgi:hypothetical protein